MYQPTETHYPIQSWVGQLFHNKSSIQRLPCLVVFLPAVWSNWALNGLPVENFRPLLPLFLLCGLCGLLMTPVFLFRTGRNCAVWCLKCLPCWLLWICLSMSPSRAFSGLVFLGPFPVCLARFPFKLLPNTWACRSSLLKGMPTWLVPCVLRPPLPCFSAWPCACSTRWSLLLCGGVCVLLPWTKSTWENCGFTMSPCLPGCLELAAILLGLWFNALLPWDILSSCGLGSMQNAGVSFWCVWCGNGMKWVGHVLRFPADHVVRQTLIGLQHSSVSRGIVRRQPAHRNVLRHLHHHGVDIATAHDRLVWPGNLWNMIGLLLMDCPLTGYLARMYFQFHWVFPVGETLLRRVFSWPTSFCARCFWSWLCSHFGIGSVF